MVSITADDFGYHHQANKAIIKLAKRGEIDRISLLVNFPKTKEAVKLYKKNNLAEKVPIGLHINVVEGEKFSSLPIFLLKLLFKKINQKQIEQELEFQIKIFKNFGLSLAHLNSHRNIHFFTPVNKAFHRIAKKHKIKYIRSKNSVIKRLKKFPLKLVLFNLYSFLNRIVFGPPTGEIRETSHFEEIIIHPGTDFDKSFFR